LLLKSDINGRLRNNNDDCNNPDTLTYKGP